MTRKFSHSIFTLFFALLGTVFANAQPEPDELPKGIKETLAKGRIEREKKDYAELLERGKEAVKLSGELEKSFTETNQISSDDRKKLERLEKLVKKIREGIGGKDDDEASIEFAERPSSILNAMKTLQSNTLKLVEELKKTSRYCVSVIAVESSNLLLKVVRFLRLGKN